METSPRSLAPLLLVVLLAACAPSSADTPGQAALRDLSSVEASILDDRVVELSEIEFSTEVLRSCVESGGMTAQVDPLQLGVDAVTVTFDAATDEEVAAFEQVIEACFAEVNAVSEVWVLQNQPTPAELDQIADELGECLRAAGLQVPGGASLEDAGTAGMTFIRSESATDEERGVVVECLQRAAVTTRTPLPGLAEALAEL